MNEDYSEDERLIINTTQKFSAKKLNFVNQTVDDTGAWPEETIGDMGQLGLFGMIIPEAYGGVFKSYRLYYKVIYEIAKSCASHALILLSHSFCAHLIEIFGNQEQKTKWLPRMAAGELLGAVAMTEPDAGSDLAAIRTKAVASGEGYILNGRKRFITNGSKARVIVVVASTSSEKTFFSKSLFVVEKTALGFKSGKSENKMGFRGSDTSELYFDEVKLDKNSLLGKRGQGLIAIMKGFEFSRLAVASVALGIAESAHNEALSYAKRREQFGRSIGEFQTIQGYLADNETGLECGRLFLKNAASMQDRGKNDSSYSAMVKYYCSEMALGVVSRAMQIHGAYGYVKEFPVERHYRDIKLCTIFEGSSEILRSIIAKNKLQSERDNIQ